MSKGKGFLNLNQFKSGKAIKRRRITKDIAFAHKKRRGSKQTKPF
jgi:hypothetical protein